MTDLEDARERTVDERARRAAVGLHRASAARVPISTSSGAPSTWHRRLLAIAAAIVVIAGIAGLYATVGRRSDPLARTSDGDPIWIIGGLPKEWTISSISGPDATRDPSGPITPPDVAVYATDDVPLGPAVVLTRGVGINEQSPLSSVASNLTESKVDGRTVVLGTWLGRRVGWVKVGITWVRIDTRPATDDRLKAIAAAVTIGPGGAPVAAGLPDGLREIASGSMGEVAPVMEYGVPFGSGRRTTVFYSRPDPPASTAGAPTGHAVFSSLTLVTGLAVRAELAMAGATLADLAPVTVGDVPGWIAHVTLDAGPTFTNVVWQRDGRMFELVGDAGSDTEAIALAASVRPANERQVPGNGGRGTTSTAADATSAAPAAPATTAPPTVPVEPSAADPILVEVSTNSVTDNEIELHGTLPDGTDFTVGVVVLADGVKVRGANGSSTSGIPATGNHLLLFGDSDSAGRTLTGPFAISSDPAARYVEVLRSNGLRYRAELTATKAHPGSRIGAVLVPQAEFVSASLLDADGNVLASMPGSG